MTRGTLAIVVAIAAAGNPAIAGGLCAAPDARIVVDTSAHKLALCDRNRETAVFDVRLGSGGVGKSKEGDRKTPLGSYPLEAPRKSKSYGTFIPIGYPTTEQRRRGYTGGAVGVHGPERRVRWLGSLVNTFDSSSGCVGLATDEDMARIATWVKTARAHVIELR